MAISTKQFTPQVMFFDLQEAIEIDWKMDECDRGVSTQLITLSWEPIKTDPKRMQIEDDFF